MDLLPQQKQKKLPEKMALRRGIKGKMGSIHKSRDKR